MTMTSAEIVPLITQYTPVMSHLWKFWIRVPIFTCCCALSSDAVKDIFWDRDIYQDRCQHTKRDI